MQQYIRNCQNKKKKTNPDPWIGSHRIGKTVIGSCGPPDGALCTCRDTGRSAGHTGSVALRTGCLQVHVEGRQLTFGL